MRQDWIGFEEYDGAKTSLRPEYIIAIHDIPIKRQDGFQIIVSYNFGDGNEEKLAVYEPYEQVKQKIMDAEKVDLSDMAVEHFTKDEYEILEYCLAEYIQSSKVPKVVSDRYAKLQNKLNKILKEDK